MMPKSETRGGNGDLMHETRKAKDSALRDVKDTAENLESRLKATAHDAGERIHEFYNANKERFNEVRDKAEHTIKDRPFTATAIAFASGVILARLFKG